MKELLSTNDVVLLSFAQDLLSQSGFDYAVFDTNMSVIEGSIGILPRRIMVADDDFEEAEALLNACLSGESSAGAVDDGSEEECGADATEAGYEDVEITDDMLSDDLFLGGALKILQPVQGFRSGIDAVLLAASLPDQPLKCGHPASSRLEVGAEAANETSINRTGDNRAGKNGFAKNGESNNGLQSEGQNGTAPVRVLEAGCGAGVVSLAIAKRCETVRIDAIEIEAVNAEIARRNARRNGLEERVTIFTGDLTEPVTRLELLGLERNSYDYVVANPPFFQAREMRFSDNPLRRRAKRAKAETLEEWVRFLTAMAAPKGVISLIHRAETLSALLAVLEGRFGALRIYPIYPKSGEPANRVIVQGVKGSRAPLTLLRGVVLHDEAGSYLPEAKSLCVGPRALPGL